MTDLPRCKLCGCTPYESAGGIRCMKTECPMSFYCAAGLTQAQWTALMGVDHPAIADPVDDHAAMRERQHIMITSQGWDRAQGTAFADGWTQCAYHYRIRRNKKIGEQQ